MLAKICFLKRITARIRVDQESRMTKKISKNKKKKEKKSGVARCANVIAHEILCSRRRCRGITFPIDLFSLYVLFSISDHVMLLEGIASFTCRLMHVQLYA